MKKLFFLLFAALLAATMMAQTPNVTLDFTDAGWGFPTSYVTDATNYTNGGYTINVNAPTGHKVMTNSGSITALLFGKKDATITLPAMSFNVSKITVKGVAGASGKVTFNIFVGDDVVSTEVKSSVDDHDFAIAADKQTAGTVYVLKVTNANNCQVSVIEFYEAVAGAPENPTFSIEEGAYMDTQTVELACVTEGAVIHYTIDGTTPSETSTIYTSALTISETTTVKAIAMKAGVSSDIVTATYTILEGIEGNGTKDNPFTVSDLAVINNGLAGKHWVKGYIVGCAANDGALSPDITNSNFALGDIATQEEGLAPIQLPLGAIRDNINLVDYPSNIGKLIKVHGDLQTYFRVPGVKNVDDYEFVETSTPTPTALDNTTNVMKPIKVFDNEKVLIKRDGKIYTIIGTRME